jgi:hypothetical protein
MLDATGAQHCVEKVLVTTRQIRDYFFAPDRSSNWTAQPSWFDILGVREPSTPAEIRLAYRVRTMELKVGPCDTKHVTQAQLARGLQILTDPDLRREYLSLLKDAEHNVSFPPWTIGFLFAFGVKRRNLFVVHGILRFAPQAEERRVRIALRRFRFEGPMAVWTCRTLSARAVGRTGRGPPRRCASQQTTDFWPVGGLVLGAPLQAAVSECRKPSAELKTR